MKKYEPIAMAAISRYRNYFPTLPKDIPPIQMRETLMPVFPSSVYFISFSLRPVCAGAESAVCPFFPSSFSKYPPSHSFRTSRDASVRRPVPGQYSPVQSEVKQSRRSVFSQKGEKYFECLCGRICLVKKRWCLSDADGVQNGLQVRQSLSCRVRYNSTACLSVSMIFLFIPSFNYCVSVLSYFTQNCNNSVTFLLKM